jgi:hypothetical protein
MNQENKNIFLQWASERGHVEVIKILEEHIAKERVCGFF